MSLDVVCFGALNVDRLFMVDKIAKADEECFVTNFEEHPGGSAANTAVGLARLGVKTGYIGKVAIDNEGRFLLQSLEREGIDTTGVVISEIGRSGVVMGYVDPKGERALYVAPGVNNSLTSREVDPEYVSSAKFLHLTSFVGEEPFKAQINLLENLPERVKVSLDPGHLYASKGLEKLRPLIRRLFVFMPNERELRAITGKGLYEGTEVLLEEGVKMVVVKLGKRGCYINDGEKSLHIKAYEVDVIDTTGAGDAFCAGFLYGLLKNKGLRECGILGNFVASRCITRMGARDGLPHLSELPSSLV